MTLAMASASPPGTDIAVIVPVYNEAASLEQCLVELCHALEQDPDRTYSLVVVDDGSADQSSEVIKQVQTRYPLTCLTNPTNMGYGAALKRGIRMSCSEWVVIVDADGTYPVDQIPLLCAQAPEVDMVVGARTGDQVEIPWVRRPAKYLLGKIANFLTSTRIPDLNSGLRVMRRDALQRFVRLCPEGFSFTTTITLAFLTTGYAVKYEPINYYRRQGISKIRPLKDTLGFLTLILRMILYFRPLRVFFPMAFVVFWIAMAKLVFDISGKLSWDLSKANISDSAVLLSGIWMILLAIGALSDMIAKRMN